MSSQNNCLLFASMVCFSKWLNTILDCLTFIALCTCNGEYPLLEVIVWKFPHYQSCPCEHRETRFNERNRSQNANLAEVNFLTPSNINKVLIVLDSLVSVLFNNVISNFVLVNHYLLNSSWCKQVDGRFLRSVALTCGGSSCSGTWHYFLWEPLHPQHDESYRFWSGVPEGMT